MFDFGMVDYAKYLIDRGLLRPPFYFNLLLGSLGTLSATPFHLAALAMSLPEGAPWGAAGIGRFQFPVNAMVVTMGGHVRVGLETTSTWIRPRERPASNLELVERSVALGRAAEREIATPAQARAIIGLDS